MRKKARSDEEKKNGKGEKYLAGKNWTAEENMEGIGGKYLRNCNLPFQMLDVCRQRLAKTAELVLETVS